MKTLLIDDERLARLELRKLLKEHPSVEVLDEAANVEDALQKIDQLKPDLIF
ncbi:MAG: response regulator, partial [Chitinophagaceae bacterium]|nr:response regulator [Chitinophagaceae bacterium]